MKTIGLIGGMSWESTSLYYRLVNEEIKRRLGGLHSARLVHRGVRHRRRAARVAHVWAIGLGHEPGKCVARQ